MKHPARELEFDTLIEGLQAAIEQGYVHRRVNPKDNLSLFIYTQKCIYEKAWNKFTLIARGLILDEVAKEVVATPFPKFFNFGEQQSTIPNIPFEVFEKLDGSLIIMYYYQSRWNTVTKGSFNSDQAHWAWVQLQELNEDDLDETVTYLFEAIYPENQIVVRYNKSELVLLAAYDNKGIEFKYHYLQEVAKDLGTRVATRFSFKNINELLAIVNTLSRDEEGFVVRFENGLRLKIKGAEYRRIHSLISNCTPLAVWNSMFSGDNLDNIRKDLPEEFWDDFDKIRNILEAKQFFLTLKLKEFVDQTVMLTDKELGLKLKDYPDDIRSFIFPYRKYGLEKCVLGILKTIRPTGNVLEGYVPSYSLSKTLQEIEQG